MYSPVIAGISFVFHLAVLGMRGLVKMGFKRIGLFIILLILGGFGGWWMLTEVKKQNIEPNYPLQGISNPGNTEEYSVWAPWWDESRVEKSLASMGVEQISQFSPLWYKLSKTGRLEMEPGRVKSRIAQMVKAKKIKLIPTIGNEFDPGRVSELVNNITRVRDFGNGLVKIGREEGYAGWDIDWEQIEAKDNTAFTEAVGLWRNMLGGEGLELAVTVHARVGSADDWVGALGHDYEGLGRVADEVRVMAYDFHFAGSGPGAITPLNDLRDVLGFAIRHIPKDKLVVGLPMYGYDWPEGGRGEPIQYEDGVRRLATGGMKRDEGSGELVGEYVRDGVMHEVWFNDSESVRAKINFAKEFGIYKFIFWRIGGEDMSFWE